MVRGSTSNGQAWPAMACVAGERYAAGVDSVTDASERAPASERSATACVAGERYVAGVDSVTDARERAPASEWLATACVAGERYAAGARHHG